MRKLFSILSFVLLYFTFAYGQAAVNIPLSASDGSLTLPLAVGLDLTATDSIDAALGESDLPPFPPAGNFEFRFDLTPYNVEPLSSYKDYRAPGDPPSFPFTGTIPHRIIWQVSTPSLPINIVYDLPTGAQMTIQDEFGGGLINIGPLSGSGTAVIPGNRTSLGAALLTMDYTNIGSLPAPVFSIAPPSLNFLTVEVGSSSTLQSTVTNTGTADLIISNITSSDPEFTFSPNSFPITIAAGDNQVFDVTFAPTSEGSKTANLTFSHNALGSPFSYSVQGVGHILAPIFSVTPPPPLDFGSVSVGGSTNRNVTVTNTGDLQLDITNLTSSDGQYTFTPNTFPIHIAPGANQVFTVTFAPTAPGTFNANLTFTHNAAGSPTLYAVTGIGFTTAPVFELDPASLAFGNVSVGGSKTLPVTVNNTGNAQLSISGIVSSDPQFTFTPNTFPIDIAAGQHQVFSVTFMPTAAGPVNATLTFTHNAAGSPSMLPLSGTGQTQGGLLKFEFPSQSLADGSTNNPDRILLNGYTGQPLKALQFHLVVGKTNGKLILRSVQRGAAIPAGNFNFSYEIVTGTPLPDGSSIDIVKVVILGNGTNVIMPNPGDQEIMKFAFDIVDITGNSAVTFNGLEEVLGATETPVINANIETGPDEIINIYNGTTQGLLGDVNLDDRVDILDILLMIDHILGRVTLTGQAFINGDIAPWTIGQPLPLPDGVINVLDLSVLQNIVLTGIYPSGDPVNKVLGNPFVVTNGLERITPGMDAKLTFYLNSYGMTVNLESVKKVKGVQIELNGVTSSIPVGTTVSSVFDQALYYQSNEFLRTLTYDGQSVPIAEGEYQIAKIPFNLSNPKDIAINKIIVADENNNALQKVEVEIIYSDAFEIPVDYWLSQNYPNPFNPTTKVKFSVPVDGSVTLKVYNMLGQEIATLFDGNAQKGTYSLSWDGKDSKGNTVSSGTYIYKMIAGDFVQSKKMVLLK